MNPMLDRRRLNRATLARQLLLRRHDLPVIDAVTHLAGVQAQTPHTWYVGLWSRLADLDPAAVAGLLVDRRLVRIALMRSTLHLVTAADARLLRPLVQPALDRDLFGNSTHGPPTAGIDLPALIAAAQEILAETPMTNRQLGERLAVRFPDRPRASLAYAVRTQVPLVQVPPRGLWGRSGPIAHTTADAWLGPAPSAGATLDDLVLRYLAAFGPASVADVQRWCGLTRLAEVVDRLRPRLVTFRDERGRELVDLPDAPRPDGDTPAPPRFLYDFDNLLVSYADRSRVVTSEHRNQRYDPHGPVSQLLLVDGFTAGDWRLERAPGAATLVVRPYRRLAATDVDAVHAEAAELLAFLAPGTAERRVDLRAAS
ncbi:winged helix DNA-binding domain-containing protein [Micromonospora sp. NPDC126480]|uniref:winged helix DNA-binding domain-containing protein n=1 Tax=Micromonospora sp. NPDC126480 TaxID=3155312 RepID=UPI003317F928